MIAADFLSLIRIGCQGECPKGVNDYPVKDKRDRVVNHHGKHDGAGSQHVIHKKSKAKITRTIENQIRLIPWSGLISIDHIQSCSAALPVYEADPHQ